MFYAALSKDFKQFGANIRQTQSCMFFQALGLPFSKCVAKNYVLYQIPATFHQKASHEKHATSQYKATSHAITGSIPSWSD